MSKYYICDKNNKKKVYGYINYNKNTGFKIKPRNNINYEGIEVSRLVLIEPVLIKNVLKRKTKIKLTAYLNFLLSIIDDDEGNENLTAVLDDARRYKAIIITKYSKFLDPIYIRDLLYRVKFVEEELREKIYETQMGMRNNYGRGGR